MARGIFVAEDFPFGGFCRGGFSIRGILSRGIFRSADFVEGDFVAGDFDGNPIENMQEMEWLEADLDWRANGPKRGRVQLEGAEMWGIAWRIERGARWSFRSSGSALEARSVWALMKELHTRSPFARRCTRRAIHRQPIQRHNSSWEAVIARPLEYKLFYIPHEIFQVPYVSRSGAFVRFGKRNTFRLSEMP